MAKCLPDTIVIHDEMCEGQEANNACCTPQLLALATPLIGVGPPVNPPEDCEPRIYWDALGLAYWNFIGGAWVQATCSMEMTVPLVGDGIPVDPPELCEPQLYWSKDIKAFYTFIDGSWVQSTCSMDIVIPLQGDGAPTDPPAECEPQLYFDKVLGCLYIYKDGAWEKIVCPTVTLPLCDSLDKTNISYVAFNGTGESTAAIAMVDMIAGTYEVVVQIPAEVIDALAFDYRNNILYCYGAINDLVYAYDINSDTLTSSAITGLPNAIYTAGAYDISRDRYIVTHESSVIFAINTSLDTAEQIGDIDVNSYPSATVGIDIEVDSCGNFYLFIDEVATKFENYLNASAVLSANIINTSGSDFGGGYGKQGGNFFGFYTNDTFYSYDFLNDAILVSPAISLGAGSEFLAGNFDLSDLATSPEAIFISFFGTYPTDENCEVLQALCFNRADGSAYTAVGSVSNGTCGDYCSNEIVPPAIDIDPILGLACICPTEVLQCDQITVPSPKPGIGDTGLDDIILGTSSIDPAEQVLTIVISNLSGGEVGPFSADFTNVSYTTFFRQTSPSVIDRTGTPEVTIAGEAIIPAITGVATMSIKVKSDGAYDPTESGEAGITINANSYVIITDANGNSRNLYIPTGSEGSITCGDFDADQGSYTDNWVITGYTFSALAATLCICPTQELQCAVTVSPAPPPTTHLENIVLTQPSIGEAEQTLQLLITSITGGDGSYTVDFSNVFYATLFRQTTPSNIDRVGTPEVVIGLTGMSIKNRTNGLYDHTEDGVASITILTGSYVTITDGSGNSADFYVPTGSEGNITCGNFGSNQGQYSDQWLITGFTGQPSTITGRLCIAPSISNPGNPDPALSGDTQLNDIVLTSANISPAEQELYLVLDSVVGGDGGPYTVEWNNVSLFTSFSEDLNRVGIRTLTEFYSSGASNSFPGGSAYAYLGVKNNTDGNYDTTKDGQALTAINAGSFVTIRDGSGNSIDLYTPAGSNGSLLCGTHLSNQGSYSDGWLITGFSGSGDPPIEALVCMSPSIGYPGHPVNGGSETDHGACDLGTLTLEQCEKEVAVIVKAITGGDGGPYVVDFSNVSWLSDAIELNPTVDRTDAHQITTDPGAGAVILNGETYEICHPNINPAFDTNKDGNVLIKTLSGSYITITDASLNTLTLYLPSGSDNENTSCQVNTTPDGDYIEQWSLLGSSVVQSPLTASLFISPSVGDPGWSGYSQSTGSGGFEELLNVINCDPSIVNGSLKALSVSIQNIKGGDEGPYAVDFSNLTFDWISEEICPISDVNFYGLTPLYFNAVGGAGNPVRTGVPRAQRQLNGHVVPFARAVIPNGILTTNKSWLITLRINGSVTITDSSLNTLTLFVPNATEGLIGGTAHTSVQGQYTDSYEIECPTCVTP